MQAQCRNNEHGGEEASGQMERYSNRGRKASIDLVSVEGSSWAWSVSTEEGFPSTARPCQASVFSSEEWDCKHRPQSPEDSVRSRGTLDGVFPEKGYTKLRFLDYRGNSRGMPGGNGWYKGKEVYDPM